MKTIITVMQSLVELNGWTVQRFDLQLNSLGDREFYAAYLTVKESDKEILIRKDGSFEFVE